MIERWKDIPGYEGHYQVSDQGRVRSVDVLVPYTHWRSGARLLRLKRGKILPQQKINSGYLIVHLNKGGQRKAKTVHRLVACAFVPGPRLAEVNHNNGVKTENVWTNLGWMGSKGNHDHAVDMGLIPTAIPVRCPRTGREFPSINRAAQEMHHSHRKVSATFERITLCHP